MKQNDSMELWGYAFLKMCNDLLSFSQWKFSMFSAMVMPHPSPPQKSNDDAKISRHLRVNLENWVSDLREPGATFVTILKNS